MYRLGSVVSVEDRPRQADANPEGVGEYVGDKACAHVIRVGPSDRPA